jgi:uncharacterized protein (TIGR04255 family)
MHYRNNHLSKVIFKLDFKAPFTNIPNEKAVDFSQGVKEKYSFSDSKLITQFTFKTTPKSSGIDQEVIGKLWEYRDKEKGDKILLLNPNYLSLQYQNRSYTNYNEFSSDIDFFYNKLQAVFTIDAFSRLGLRYINEISISEGNPLEWNGYIKEELLHCTFAGLSREMKLARSMHQLVTKYDEDTSVLLQYGIHNPDFPNPVARRQYILDIDCFISGTIERNEVTNHLSNLNIVATEIFENSIDQKLRELMEVVS